MSNTVIVSAKGFYAGLDKIESGSRDTKDFKVVFKPKWTKTISKAEFIKNKTAEGIIEKHKLEAWVWRPYMQREKSERIYEVRQVKHYGFLDQYDMVEEFAAVRVNYDTETDIHFLNRKGKDTGLLTKEEAENIAREKNLEMLNELKRKLGLDEK